MIDMGYVHGLAKARELIRNIAESKNVEAEEMFGRLKKIYEIPYSETTQAQKDEQNELHVAHHAVCEQVILLCDIVRKLGDEIRAEEESEREAV